ncbi:MAG: EXPERA domain-containing protein [Aggregatilineales bacterium]
MGAAVVATQPPARVIPISKRRYDWPILIFFLLNLLFITYIVDLEQLVIPDANHFTYPIWPPSFMIDAIHSYGHTFDPVLIARPAWWRATIWIDVLLFGPFYVAAIYAFVRGKHWIRVPALVYSGMMLSNVLIILFEEVYGPFPAPQFGIVLLLNLPWLLMPLYIIYRVSRSPKLFTES